MVEDKRAETLELLQGWHDGNRYALEQLIEKHLPWMHDYVRRRIGQHLRAAGDTVDFVQDAMVQVLEYGPKFQVADEDQFRGLLARIVENHLRSQNRNLHRQKRDIKRQRLVPSDTVLSLDPPQKGVTRPSQHVAAEEGRAWVRLALEFLAPMDREAIVLHEWEGLGFRAIGESLGISEGAAQMRFQRALPRLAKKVKELQTGQLNDVLASAARRTPQDDS